MLIILALFWIYVIELKLVSGVNQRGMKSSFAGFHPGIQQDCMENSIEKGRKLIYQFASSLSIHGHCADLAHGFYKMLLERRFMRGGRRNALVG